MSTRTRGTRIASVLRRSIPGLALAVCVISCDRPRDVHVASSGVEAGDSMARTPGARTTQLTFRDVTESSGIRFRHTSGARGEKLLPETLGAGAALLDVDGDGHLDVFLVDSCEWSRAFEPPALARDLDEPQCRLFRGLGGGRFEDVTARSGVGITLHGMGCAVGDFDGDGDPDVYITAVGDNVLLRNDGGRFQDITREAGVAGGHWVDKEGTAHPEWSTSAVWLDVDGDERLDLFVANYVEWSPEHEIYTTLDGVSKAFTTPERYEGLPPRLYRNRGDGRFEDISERAGISGEKGKALGVALWDFQGDRRLDIVVANDTRPNFLLVNEGGGRFRERGLEAGIAYDENGRARAGMGIDIADLAGDGRPVVLIGNFSNEPVSLYRWSSGGVFSSEAERAGLSLATHATLAFGVLLADLDLDGALDLLVVNGHIEPEIAATSPRESHAQSPHLFLGNDAGTFDDVSGAVGVDFARPRVARGLAAGDIDGDGDLDLLVTTNGGSVAILRNDQREKSHFLRVRLEGRAPNTEAIGAVVRLTSTERRQVRTARGGSSYLSESERTMTFGLGPAPEVQSLEVVWPDGNVTRVDAPIELDRTLEIRQPPTSEAPKARSR